MSGVASDPMTLERFRALLAERLGWRFADHDAAQVAAAFDQRAAHLALDHRAYLRHLRASGWRDEEPALIAALSITETYFFRHAEQMRALAEAAVPDRLRARAQWRVLRMLSVGCSSGEEAYTLQMLARSAEPGPDWQISTIGLDANQAMLDRAAAGRYSAWSLRETPESFKRRWFRPGHGDFELDPKLRADVRFRLYNVADDDALLWRSGQYDIVCCRNLLMYLTPEVAAGLVRRMSTALAPGGYLFLGHTDTLGSRPDGLEPQHTHGTYYYRRAEPAMPGRPQGSAARPPVQQQAPGKTLDRNGVIGLLRDERFTEALTRIEAGLPHRPEPYDLLLHGVTLVQTGRFDAAEAVSHRLLELDGLHADGYHLLGVCGEGLGAGREAEEHFRLAAYLDRGFAMPRLRLGLRLRRQGDARAACDDLAAALDLLRAERDERIVLFGGGFGRSSLIGLCRTELELCRSSR